MRRSRTLVFAAVTAAAVALSGCSATVTGSPGAHRRVHERRGCRRADHRPGGVDGQGLRLAAAAAGFAVHEARSSTRTTRPPRSRRCRTSSARARRPSTRRCPVSMPPGPPRWPTATRPSPRSSRRSPPSARRSTRPRSPSTRSTRTTCRSWSTALPQAVAPLQELSKLQDPTTDLQSSPELEGRRRQGAQLPDAGEQLGVDRRTSGRSGVGPSSPARGVPISRTRTRVLECALCRSSRCSPRTPGPPR